MVIRKLLHEFMICVEEIMNFFSNAPVERTGGSI